MRFVEAYSLHNGDGEFARRELSEWLTDLFEIPEIVIEPGCTGRIRSRLQDELTNSGWSSNVRIDPTYDLTVTGRKRDMAFQIQTGNISRAIYDLVKFQHLYHQKVIGVAALAVPTKSAAEVIGSNVAHADRLWGELQLFDRIFTMPLLLVAFE
jgi:hypothetical protein